MLDYTMCVSKNMHFMVLISFKSGGATTDLAMHFLLRTILSRSPKEPQVNSHLLMTEMCGYWRYLLDLEILLCAHPLYQYALRFDTALIPLSSDDIVQYKSKKNFFHCHINHSNRWCTSR